MKTIFYILAALFFSAGAILVPSHAIANQQKIIWSCSKHTGSKSVLWLVEHGDNSYVKVFDQRIKADYGMDGLSKRWDFGLQKDGVYDFAVILAPDLKAIYYDFSTSKDGTAKGRDLYYCKRG